MKRFAADGNGIGRFALFVAAAAFAGGLVGFAAIASAATAALKDPNGGDVGTATLTETPNGLKLNVEITNLPPGSHAFHIHEKGACAPDFAAAGGHFNPHGKKHGFGMKGGKHAGDLPNITVPASGKITFEAFADGLTLKKGAKNSVFDADGAAMVVHAGVDDHTSQPSGAAGDRIACGVIK